MPSMQKLKSKVITFTGTLQCPGKTRTFISMLQILWGEKKKNKMWLDCIVLIFMLGICITEVRLSGGKKSRVFSGTKKEHSCFTSMVAACVQLSEQKEKVYGFCSLFMQPIARVQAGWRLAFSASAEAFPHLSCWGQGNLICTRWAALSDPCLEQVTELQSAPHVG